MIHIIRFTCPKCKRTHVLTSWAGKSAGCVSTSTFSCLVEKKKNMYARISHRELCNNCDSRVSCLSGERGTYVYIVNDFERVPVYVLRLRTEVSVDIQFYGKVMSLSRMAPKNIDRSRSTTETVFYFEDWIALTEWGDSAMARFKEFGYTVKRRILRKENKWGQIDYRLDVSD